MRMSSWWLYALPVTVLHNYRLHSHPLDHSSLLFSFHPQQPPLLSSPQQCRIPSPINSAESTSPSCSTDSFISMKRQATLRSSSSVRETADTSTVHHVANSVGCMAGVFHIISSKYRTRRKFLTFGRRLSPSSKQNSPARNCNAKKNADLKEAAREFRKLSCEVPRSPTIPPEIRRSNSLNSPESFRSPVPSVVARLMGLENTPPPPVTVMPSPPPELASEKRRKLLGALEKCDEDLQELKRIIEAVRTTDRSPRLFSVGKGGETKKFTESAVNGINEEQPSPVSVLEDFCDSPPSPTSFSAGRNSSTKFTQIGRASTLQLQRKKPMEDNARLRLQPKSDTTFAIPPPRRSGGDSMEKAVNDVCKDVETGQEREIERLGVVFEDFIYRDLIEELMKDLLGRGLRVESSCLPFEKCKRKLRF